MVAATGARAQSVLLTQPNDGQVWAGGTKQLIKWTASNMNNVKIDYSIDSTLTWINITPSYPAAVGQYEWNVPETPSAKCFIRISDLEDPSIFSKSTQAFTIPPPYLTLIYLPFSFTPQAPSIIRWDYVSVGKVKLSYSTDNSAWKTIATNIDASRKYMNWVAPSGISFTWLKIESVSNSAVEFTSGPIPVLSSDTATPVKYRGGSYDGHTYATTASKTVQVLTPLLNAVYRAGANMEISWKAMHIDLLKIDFSADSGATWTNVRTAPAAQAKTNWVVPAQYSDKCLIRLRDVNDSTQTFAVSPVFKIENAYLQLQEIAGKTTIVGAAFPVKWKQEGVPKLDVYYSETGNAPWKLQAQAVNGNLGYYLWKVKDSLPTVYFKLVASDNPALNSQSQYSLSIINPVADIQKYRGGSYDGATMGTTLPGFLKIINPVKGQRYPAGNHTDIKWSFAGVSAIHIHYSPDSGITWQTVAENIPASDLKYIWNIPVQLTTKGRMRITNSEDPSMTAYSDSVFSIVFTSIKLISPVKQITIAKNTVVPIRWTQTGVDSVSIAYSADNGANWTTIASKANASRGVFNWVANGPENMPLRLLIKDLRSGGPADTTSATVTISSPLEPVAAKYKGGSYDGHSLRSNITVLQLKSPQGGEVMRSGSTFNITWDAYNLEDSIRIELSIDSGRTWTTIVQVSVTSGSYNWKIEDHYLRKAGSIYGREIIDVTNDKCQIRLSSFQEDESAVTLNQQNFTIITSKEVDPVLDILRPVKEDTLVAGSNFSITWTSTAITGNVNIDMSPDSGKTWITVANAAPNSGSFNWTVPQRLSWTNYTGKGWIRIIAGDVKDTSQLFNWKQSIVTAITDINIRFDLKVYPNPASRFLYINGKFTSSKTFVLTLRDLTGRTLFEKKYTGIINEWMEKIDVQKIPAGMTFISIRFNDREIVTLPVFIAR